jgi:hypothetical protein
MLQCRHLFDDGWAGSGGEGGRPKSEDKLRRMLPAMLFFRFGDLAESEGVRGSDCVAMLSTVVSTVSADWSVRVGIGTSGGLD